MAKFDPAVRLVAEIAESNSGTEAHNKICLFLEKYEDFLMTKLAEFDACMTGDCPHDSKWDCYKGHIIEFLKEE